MDTQEFYDYLLKNFNLDGTSGRLVRNILEYVKAEDFVDAEDAHTHLDALLGGAFGLTEQEIKLYRADELDECKTPTLKETLAKYAAQSREMFGDTDKSAPQLQRDEL